MPFSRFTINNGSRSPGIGEAIIFPPRSASGCTLHILEVSVSNADNRYGAVIGADQCQVAAPSAVYALYTATHCRYAPESDTPVQDTMETFKYPDIHSPDKHTHLRLS